MSLKTNLWGLTLVPLVISPLYGRQEIRTISPPPPILRYVAPLFGLSNNPCLPMSVRLNVTIGQAGDVNEVQVISGPPGLHKPVTEAVRLWLFEPSVIDGKPAQVRTEVEVPNSPPDAKCQLPVPSPKFSFPFTGVEGVGVKFGNSAYGCADCWFIKTEGGVGGPRDGGPGMLFRLRSETGELEFKCRAHECTVTNTAASPVSIPTRTMQFDEGGVIPISARVTFTVVK